MNELQKQNCKKGHLIETYDDIYLPIAFILLIAFILGLIGTKYNQGYSIPVTKQTQQTVHWYA